MDIQGDHWMFLFLLTFNESVTISMLPAEAKTAKSFADADHSEHQEGQSTNAGCDLDLPHVLL